MAETAARTRSRRVSMGSHKSVPPIDRAALKASFFKPPSKPPSVSSSRPISAPSHPRFQSPPWLLDFWASEKGVLILEFWHKSILPFKSFPIILGLMYCIFIILVSYNYFLAAEDDLAYLSKVLKVAGDFSETIDDAYLFEQFPTVFRSASADLREFYTDHIKKNDPFAVPMYNLLAEVEALQFNWESFALSRDNAITSVKQHVQSSRAIFNEEYEKLTPKKTEVSQWWRRQFKRLVLKDPYEAHFEPATFLNVTGEMELLISTWRASMIPDLTFRLVSEKRGRMGGLPGQIREVEDEWPWKSWGDVRFRGPPVERLEEVRKKAVSVLEGVSRDYERIWLAIHLLDKVDGMGKGEKFSLGGGFAWWHLEELLKRFDRTIQRLEDAEWNVRKRQNSRND
ncbi:hypothetical protein EYC80_009727 [Monilinia laxa]|uniref:Uncharacterized protein n=1 Tax=Monilinia laxa TaxID=61186 RepID=A0A5N6JYT5_MONLA|nr:hypothetical protein EYC80_009727 [Monilinia laxa]